MNPRLFLPALLAASLASAQPAAPDAGPAKAESPSAAADGKAEMQKWIEASDAQWQAVFKRDVTDVREAEAKKLMLQYLTSLEDAIKKASLASDLEGAVALRNEQKRFGETQLFPEQDDAADAAAVKPIRTAIRGQLAKLDKDTATRAKALHTKYDLVLSQAQAQLTQRQRLDDALLVKAKREEVSAAWLSSGAVPAAPVSVAVQPKPPSLTPVEPPKTPPAPQATMTPVGNGRIADATKDRPFVNGLGMKFVPVPIMGGPTGGQRVMFSIWETRVQDYQGFAKSKRVAWRGSGAPGPTHPAVHVAWEDARAYCEWLTERERQGGRLARTECYRLPTDHEWSCAVGIGDRENPEEDPNEKSRKIKKVYPWGDILPRPPDAGNYIGGDDGFRGTAPAGSFKANAFGLFDLGGNVREWCEDPPGVKLTEHILRDAAFNNGDDSLLSSHRQFVGNDFHPQTCGFRAVIAPVVPAR